MSLAAPNLNDILLRLFDDLGELQKYGIATGGSSTTLADTGLGGSDDDWNGGTVFVVEADGAAPEGQFAEVTDYTTADGVLTFGSTGINGITAAPAALDEYALASDKYHLDKMRSFVNRGLVRMGDIPNTDETLTTAASTTEYTIPAAARWGLRRVYVAQYATASNERWVENTTWRQEASILIFRRQPPVSKTIKLVYMGPHSRLAAYSDTLDANVALNRAVAEAYYVALTDPLSTLEDPLSQRQLQEAKDELNRMRGVYPIWDPGSPFKPILSGRKGKRQRRRERYGSFYT